MEPYSYCNCRSCSRKRGYQCKGTPSQINNHPSNTNTFNPSITINVSTGSTPHHLGVETTQYIAMAEERKLTYTNQDALKIYGSSDILDPNSVSTILLFVNGVLQPDSIYTVKEGRLTLNTNDPPPKNAPIILLFVSIKE